MIELNPLIGEPPKEVPLTAAPIVRVISQTMFPSILSIGDEKFVAPFQEAIREKYPVLRAEEVQSIIINPQGLVQTASQKIWRFSDVNGYWRVSLAPSFISLETTNYLSRSDFVQHLEYMLQAVNSHIKPQVIERFGLRYVDRLVEQNMKDVPNLVRPEVAGILATGVKDNILQTISESLLNLPEMQAQMIIRSGLLSANSTIDPALLEPINEPSWILDIDMSRSTQRAFHVEELADEAYKFAERIYGTFRWMVNNEFLKRFGGKP